ncbi:MAG: hypothetical protein NT136_00330 [Candidatus Moranbacteria bacterium]|nr:hypothetical protein [Candidatus Moranbacteria bacterium]
MRIIVNNKNLLITIAVALICLILYSVFPTQNIFQQIVSTMAFLLVIPVLYIKIILKGSLKKFGLQTGDRQRGILWMGIMLLGSLLTFYILFHYTNLPQHYHPPRLIAERFVFFISYELLLVGLFAALYEFFFRGFIMLRLSRAIGYWSIAVQFAVFLTFFLLVGGLDWSTTLYVIVSPFAGIVAYQSRSIFYSFGTSLFFIIIADALVIGLAK